MNEPLILGVIIVAVWVGLVLLRVPSSIAFLSLLIGQLLANESADDVFNAIGPSLKISDAMFIEAGLLLLPLALTIILLRKRVPTSKRFIEAIPSLFVILLTVVLIAPYIPVVNSAIEIASNDQVSVSKTIIVIAASASGLVSAWLSYPKAAKSKEK